VLHNVANHIIIITILLKWQISESYLVFLIMQDANISFVVNGTVLIIKLYPLPVQSFFLWS